MYAAVIIIHVIVSIALILIVLLQAGKGSGIANVFGGAGQTVFGARTGDVLAKGTTICAAVFMASCLTLAILSSDRSSSVMRRHAAERPAPALPLAIPGSAQPAPVQPATMEKLRAIMSNVTDTVKKAATTAATQPAQTSPSTSAAPAAASGPVQQKETAPASTH